MKRAPLAVIGWREWVTLPQLGNSSTKAKIDTGARTSAIHAFDLETFDRDGVEWVRFELHPAQRSRMPSEVVEAAVTEHRRIRSSNGQRELRPVITTPMRIGDHEFSADLTLTSRDEMGFRMLLGRTALRRRFVIDPARSFIHGKEPAS